jgi:hypothetical protein
MEEWEFLDCSIPEEPPNQQSVFDIQTIDLYCFEILGDPKRKCTRRQVLEVMLETEKKQVPLSEARVAYICWECIYICVAEPSTFYIDELPHPTGICVCCGGEAILILASRL